MNVINGNCKRLMKNGRKNIELLHTLHKTHSIMCPADMYPLPAPRYEIAAGRAVR